MSAFLVEDKTINSVITYLSNMRDGTWYRNKIKDKLGFDLETLEGKQGLGWAMFKLNIRAVNQRYVNGQAEDFRPLNYRFCLSDGYVLPAVIKQLSCWLYQCSEGDCPSSEVFKVMDELKGDLCYKVVSRTKEYEMASWG